MKRLRCCGTWCYWRLPLGPWQCGRCERTYDGPMPRNAEGRFWEHVAGKVALAERAAAAPPSMSRALLWELFGFRRL